MLIKKDCGQGAASQDDLSDRPTCQLDASIQELIVDTTEKSYQTLVKQLQQKSVQYFETPLMSSDATSGNDEAKQFLQFMQVTMKMVREREKDVYTNLINQLINCRANYIELSYSQMIQQVFIQVEQKQNSIFGGSAVQAKQPGARAQGSQNYGSGEAVAATTAETQVALTFRQTTSILSWLHQNLLNEVLILESSALDSFKYAEVLNTVFGDRLPKRVSYRVQAQIE